jgi:HlyD family secretion protein
MIKWFTILLAIAGVLLGAATVRTAYQQAPDIPPSRPPSINPFGRGVASLGKIESREREVEIAAPQPGLVTAVLADVGDVVDAGQPLLQLDVRPLQADLVRAQAAVLAAQAEIDRWHALPRVEDIPPLEAAVEQFNALLLDRQERLKLTEDARQRGGATDRDVSREIYAVQEAKAALQRAGADLLKMRAGGWKPDLAVAQANLAGAQAEVEALTLLNERLTVRAPRRGIILRRSIEPGEYASADPARPAMILGSPDSLRVRAQVDEEDIGLVGPASAAVARTRGAVVQEIRLTLVRIEPFARPKTDLTGANIERVDTRIIDVIFDVTSTATSPLYPGQAVDVYIDSPGSAGGPAGPNATSKVGPS